MSRATINAGYQTIGSPYRAVHAAMSGREFAEELGWFRIFTLPQTGERQKIVGFGATGAAGVR